MDQLQDVLALVRDKGLVKGRLRGLFHVAIGRTLKRANGTVVSTGATWRELASLLRDLRFDPELVRELGADPDTLSPRDRFKFWYSAIALAKVGSPAAYAEAEKLATALKPLGYLVTSSPAPATPQPKPQSVSPPPTEKKKGKPKK